MTLYGSFSVLYKFQLDKSWNEMTFTIGDIVMLSKVKLQIKFLQTNNLDISIWSFKLFERAIKLA